MNSCAPKNVRKRGIKQLEGQARAREADLARAVKEATVAEANEAGVEVSSAMPLEQIRSVLPADTALVEYFCAHDRYVACVLTRKKLHIGPVTLQSRIQKLLQLLQFQISKFRLDPQYVALSVSLAASTQAHLGSLYQELIAPIQHLLDAGTWSLCSMVCFTTFRFMPCTMANRI